MVQEPANWFTRTWAALGHISLAREILGWLFKLALALGATSLWAELRPMVQPQDYIHAATVFVTTLTVVIGTGEAVKYYVPRFKRWRNPHSLVLTVAGGDNRCVVNLRHFGVPATWWADARVTKTQDEPNPSSEWHQCTIHKDGKRYQKVVLGDDDWATIVLGHLQINDFPSRRNVWLRVIEHVFLQQRWAEVELILKSNPPMKGGAIKKKYKVTWKQRALEAELIATD